MFLLQMFLFSWYISDKFHVEQFTPLTFRWICEKNGIVVADRQLSLLEQYVSLLLQANRSINLISRKDQDKIWPNHILHSIAPAFRLSFAQLESILDLGTGGGFPGIPLKVIFPTIQFTLVDSVLKKTKAVSDIIQKLNLEGISVIHSRVEDLPKIQDYCQKYDAVICRGVAPLKKLIVWSMPLLKESAGDLTASRNHKTPITPGTLLAFKGGNIEGEVLEAKRDKRVRSIQETPLVFHGSEIVSWTDKKILLVRFNS